jgi:hypothetical protein
MEMDRSMDSKNIPVFTISMVKYRISLSIDEEMQNHILTELDLVSNKLKLTRNM